MECVGMVLVTLIGCEQARVGNRFYYCASLSDCKECKGCKLRSVCFNLDSGSLYEIKSLRDTEHECALNESKVRVVEVEKKPFRAVVSKKLAIDGSMITFEPQVCTNLGCENYGLCHPDNVKSGDKLSVKDVIEDITCPLTDDKLTVVRLM